VWDTTNDLLTSWNLRPTISISRDKNPNRHSLRWFQEVWTYWRDCFAEDGTLSDEYAEDLATKFGDSKLLQAFPDKSDRRLICHALAYECDTFCTRDHKTIIKKAKLIDAELPLEILTPKQWGERINALGGF
jgi:hypothetical protein